MSEREPIAIIGIGCRFPGGVDTPAAFWRLLRDGGFAITGIPRDRFDLDLYYDPRPATPGKVNTRWGGFLDNLDRFDADFFGIAPREAERLDPQQRLLLEVSWEALENGGIPVESLAGSPTGVFVGLWLSDYEARLFCDPAGADFYMTTGSGRYAASGRLSYVFGLQGPSFTIDAACASSLAAVHLACQSLWSGESALALAGGANVILQPHISVAYSQWRMLAADGKCKFGDASADGYVRSEGAGIVVLKPLSAARRDGDRIYAVILGGAVNNDGRTSGSLMRPGQGGQEDMLRKAYRHAGVSPSAVQYVEAHGTGTRAGDPVELGALGTVMADGRAREHPCAVGSVKTNIGHTEGAAGIAGLIKVALSLEHRTIPASLHFREPNPNVPWADLSLYIPTEARSWPAGPAFAGVSSYGIAGTNAHIVLGRPEDIAARPAAIAAAERPRIVAISGRSPEALTEQARRWRDWLNGAGDEAPADAIAYTSTRRRSHLEHRVAVVGATRQEWAQRLDAYLRGESVEGVASGRAREGAHRVVFVFPGQGGQWRGMGRRLLEREPAFRAEIDAWDRTFLETAGWSLISELTADAESSRQDDIAVVQPTLFAVEAALAALWRSWGVEPYAVVGHSMGEAAAAYVAGALSRDEAARIICRRSELLRRISGRGAMVLVELTVDEARGALAGLEDRVSVAVSNSSRSTVMSGDPAAIDSLVAALESREIFCRRVKVDVASHSPQVEPLLPELAASLAAVKPRSTKIPLYSTVTASWLEGSTLGAAYWARNLREPVRFAEAMRALIASGCDTFIEMGPHPVLVPAIQQELGKQLESPVLAVPSLRRDEDEQTVMLESLGALHASGVAVTFERLYPSGRVMSLPSYSWQRERYWHDSGDINAGVRVATSSRHALLGWPLELADWSDTSAWENDLTRGWPGLTFEHRVGGASLVGASTFVELAVAAAESRFGPGPWCIEGVEFREPLVLAEGEHRRLQVTLSGPDDGATFEVFSRGQDGWIGHALARVRRGTAPADGPSLDEFRQRCHDEVSHEHFYARLEEHGLKLGDAIRGVRRLWIGPDAALVECAESAQAPQGLGNTRMAPPLLDACFQVAATAGLLRGTDGVLIPVRVGRISMPREPLVRAWLGLSWRSGDGETTSCTIQVLDERGQAVATIQDLRVVPLDPGSRSPGRDLRDAQYTVEWRSAPAPAPRVAVSGVWLVLADSGGVGDALAAGLESEGARVTTAYAAGQLRRMGPTAWQTRQDEPTDMAAVITAAAMSSDGALSLSGVVHLWGLDAAGDSDPSPATCQSVVTVLRDLSTRGFGHVPRLWLVTRGAQAVAQEPELSVAQSALWGLGRVASEEHPELWGGLVDLDPRAEPAASARALLEHLAGGGPEDAAALRDGGCQVPRLVHRPRTKQRAIALRRDAAYLITGGLGALGLRVARWMADRGARRLVLLGRHGLPPRATWASARLDPRLSHRIGAVLEIERLGASVHVTEVDVADASALGSFLDDYRRDGWPPIRGVVHCAGAIHDRLLVDLDAEGIEASMRAKARGAWALDRAFAGQALDFFALFSSLGSLWGQAGQGGYAAANAFLDTLAHERRRRGEPGLSLNWGAWAGLGFTNSAGGRATSAELERRGVHTLDPDQALEAFGQLLLGDAVQVAILPIDRVRLASAGALRIPRLLSELAVSEATATVSTGQSQREQLLGTPLEDRRERLESFVQQQIAAVLKQPPARIDRTRPLRNLGMDSLTALELRRRLEIAFDLKLSATLAWNHPTVAALAVYLASRLDLALERAAIVAEPVPATLPPVLETVAELSDEEALQALLQKNSPRP